MVDRPYDIISDEGIPVKLPSGATFYTLTQSEADYLHERVGLYTESFKFTAISDTQDVDKMITFELLIHRWSMWLSRGVDYYNNPINERTLADQTHRFSNELRQIKKTLGVDKPTRDKVRGDDSVSSYIENLRRRAKEFGIHRNEQAEKSIELFQRLKALTIFHDNCSEEEQQENHATAEEVLTWIRDVAVPEFDELDSVFRAKQKMWIRKL